MNKLWKTKRKQQATLCKEGNFHYLSDKRDIKSYLAWEKTNKFQEKKKKKKRELTPKTVEHQGHLLVKRLHIKLAQKQKEKEKTSCHATKKNIIPNRINLYSLKIRTKTANRKLDQRDKTFNEKKNKRKETIHKGKRFCFTCT